MQEFRNYLDMRTKVWSHSLVKPPPPIPLRALGLFEDLTAGPAAAVGILQLTFTQLLDARGYEGAIDIDHPGERLTLEVKTNKSGEQATTTKGLSGNRRARRNTCSSPSQCFGGAPGLWVGWSRTRRRAVVLHHCVHHGAVGGHAVPIPLLG